MVGPDPYFLRSILILWVLAPTLLFSQDISRKEAQSAFEASAYEYALPYYAGKYLNGEKKIQHFRYGICAVHNPSHRKKGVEVLDSLADDGFDQALFWAGVGHQKAGSNEEALARFHGYKERDDETIPSGQVERWIQIAVRAQVRRNENVHVNPRRVRYSEGLEAERALMTHDGDELFFQGVDQDHILLAGLSEGALRLKDTVLEKEGMALAGLSSDGSTVILRKAQEKKPWRHDLYRVEREENGWSNAEAFGPNINTKADESSAWISEDGQKMIFSSAREGGSGGLDLYISRKLPTGKWAKAKNLSPSVNSSYDETAPCLLADGKELYFVSDGHQTMGGKDIFRSYYEADKERWIVPEAPGFPINNEQDELSVSLTGKGKELLLTRGFRHPPHRRTEFIELLYKFEHLEHLKGKVLDQNGDPLKAKITLLDPKERTVRGIYRTRSRDGGFVLAIRPHKDFELIVEAEGYVPKTKKVRIGGGKVEIRLEEE